MNIDTVSEKILRDIVTGEIEFKFDFLALKILLSRLLLNVKHDASPDSVKKAVNELKEFFKKTQNIPLSQQDLQKILNKGGI